MDPTPWCELSRLSSSMSPAHQTVEGSLAVGPVGQELPQSHRSHPRDTRLHRASTWRWMDVMSGI